MIYIQLKKIFNRYIWNRFNLLIPLFLIVALYLNYAGQPKQLSGSSLPQHLVAKHSESRFTIPAPPPDIPVKPKIAIIIDDIGYDLLMLNHFLTLDASLTYSVLPFSPYQKTSIGLLMAGGFEIMMHLPMEPIEYPDILPGPGALLKRMTPEELTQCIILNLKGFPSVKGVNNHMGSRFTTIPRKMIHVMSIFKQLDLYFVDSFTTHESVCRSSARLTQVRFAKRDVFLDHLQTPEFIIQQLDKLIQFAEMNGEAIGIGHPYPATYQALEIMLPEIKRRAIIVPASEVVHTIR